MPARITCNPSLIRSSYCEIPFVETAVGRPFSTPEHYMDYTDITLKISQAQISIALPTRIKRAAK